MLKIKDNVDLKELEKFGFVPKYSEETGELVEMFCVEQMPGNWWSHCYARCGLRLRKGNYKVKRLKIYKKNKNESWVIDNRDMFDRFHTDKLYDLIQAGLVEKVEE